MGYVGRRNPRLYEINARVFVNRLWRENGRTLGLVSVPDQTWRDLALRGFDLVWLMGVWRRSPAARRAALEDAGLRSAYDAALPGWSESDVGASPYAVFDYVLDRSLGEPEELAQVRRRLDQEGLGLILDFVPNHLAMDHRWVALHPYRFVRGSENALREHPDWFFSPDGKSFIAHGRDPNFPPWTDTAQVDFFSPDMREAMLGELLRIAQTADGVRCDMAMLGLNDVFARVWERQIPPVEEFWSEIIAGVRRAFPGFLFIGEAYWGLETELLSLGFDFVYDRGFYDKLRWASAREIRDHLLGTSDGTRRVRFIENHDEARAAEAFGERLTAATAVLATVPGLRLFHDGQIEGRQVRLPVQLLRDPEERDHPPVSKSLNRLLEVTRDPIYHEGTWNPMETGSEVLAWSWRLHHREKVVVVNYGHAPSSARLAGAGTVRDELSGAVERIEERGIALAPWEARLLDVQSDES